MNKKSVYLKLLGFYGKKTEKREDKGVLDFLHKVDNKEKLYIEIGAGLGRFIGLVKKQYQFQCSAVEINNDLANKVEQMGIKTYNINFLDNELPENHFDVVHCSHVIEHVAYPKVIQFLDELIRITKPGGHIIIRSPLLTADFFTCIDHIRPYPPKAILDYYSNPQQQVTGKHSISAVKIRLRRGAYQVNPYSYSPLFRGINLLLKLSWGLFRFPFSKPNGYTAIFVKNQ